MKNFVSNIKYRLILKIIFTQAYNASTVIRSSESGRGGGGRLEYCVGEACKVSSGSAF